MDNEAGSDTMVVGWESSPSRRGTLNIITSCLFTIFACTWSIQHLNVPGLGDSFLAKLGRKCKWAVLTVFFPELLMAHAILELVMAARDMVALDTKGRPVRFPWWFRYIVQRRNTPSGVSSRDEETADEDDNTTTTTNIKWTLTHCYFANMGGFYLRDKPGSPVAHLLTTRHFANCWEDVVIPELTEDDLNDKSKTDYLTKAIATVQIAELVVSLGARSVRHLAFSQLETLTLAFAICGVLTYICYWYKPQDVRRPIRVQLSQEDGGQLPRNIILERTFDGLWDILADSSETKLKTDGDQKQPLERIRNDNIPNTEPQTATHYALYVLAVLTTAFGALHAIAWNFEFPTPAEQTLWRVATLVSTVAPLLALITIPLSQLVRPWGDSRDFMRTCLRVMREYHWHAADKAPVRAAIGRLEGAYDDTGVRNTHYRDIFLQDADPSDESPNFPAAELLSFMRSNKDRDFPGRDVKPNDANLPSDMLDGDFVEKFRQLVAILEGNAGSKKLADQAETNVYPRRAVFAGPASLAIIYGMGIVYCIARLSLIGVAFSSLRRAPDSVYTTTWAADIPNVQ